MVLTPGVQTLIAKGSLAIIYFLCSFDGLSTTRRRSTYYALEEDISGWQARIDGRREFSTFDAKVMANISAFK